MHHENLQQNLSVYVYIIEDKMKERKRKGGGDEITIRVEDKRIIIRKG